MEHPLNLNFENIYKEHWDSVFRICMGYTARTSDAKDLAQDAFVNVLKALPNFREDANIRTWIYRITTNVCLRFVEKEKKHQRVDLKEQDLKSSDPSTEIESRTTFLYQAISELPELERLLISLELEDVDQKEIAKIIGITNENVRVKIYRIKKKLTKKFEEYEH